MITKTITIANKEVTLAYCYATEIAFQRYTGTGLENFDATNSEHVVYLVLSAVLAYNEATKKAPEDAPIKDTDLMYEAKPADLVLALATVFELRKQWYEVPDGDTAEKAEEEDKGKN